MFPSRKQVILLVLAAAFLSQERPVQAQVDSLRLNRNEAQERALIHSTEIGRRAAAGIEARHLARVPYLHNPEISIVGGTTASKHAWVGFAP